MMDGPESGPDIDAARAIRVLAFEGLMSRGRSLASGTVGFTARATRSCGWLLASVAETPVGMRSSGRSASTQGHAIRTREWLLLLSGVLFDATPSEGALEHSCSTEAF